MEQAFDRYLRARRAQFDLLETNVEAISALLSPEQKRKLPAQITNYLDPRFLRLVREGSGIYVSSGGGFFGGFVGFGGFGGPAEGFVEIRR